MRRLILLTAAWLILGSAGSLFAQGVQTGTIRGMVKDQQDLAVPGVTVTATSPALQGPRSTVTDMEGLFAIRALPPGDYQVKFELSGFSTITRNTAVPLGLVVETNVSLRAAGVAETVQVTAEAPAPITTPVVGANFKNEEINALATPRTIQGIATLAPAVTENSPNAGQIIINGAFAFDNVFMINGVDVNDNLFATPQNLFIEDAIEETQVLTSGISAEYGRFSGGVVNAITKSGGNSFSGSYRTNFSNPKWTTQTPFEACLDKTTITCTKSTEHVDKLSRTYEATFGGPIVRDRLWFFTSGRYAKTTSQITLPRTGIALSGLDQNKRGEIKITGTPVNSHTIQGGFLNDPRHRTNNSGLQGFVIDPHSEVDRDNPNWYYFTNYKGIMKSSRLVEVQYSQRHFKFANDGGTSTNLKDSPFLDVDQCSPGCVYNAPYFDATDPEERNNRQITGSVTNFWNASGGHETKAGYEWYRSQRTGGNSQSSTSYVFNSNFVEDAAGNPVLDSTGRPIPNFVPGVSSLDNYRAVRGATMNVDNNSLYIQDHWTINSRWSADLGARYEHVLVKSTGDIISIKNNRIVPRLAVSWDTQGNGNHIVHVTYGQYAGRYNEAQIGQNSPVGIPVDIFPIYQGPAGQGYNFAPGFNLANYPVTSANAAVTDPLQNVQMAAGTKSPLTHEFSASYGANILNGRGYGEIAYVARTTRSLIEDFQTIAGGFTTVLVSGVSAGTFTNKVYQNTDQAHRQYQGLVFQSRYRITNPWSVNGQYTVQLKNDGNYEGEAGNQPGATSIIGNFPEAFSAVRNFPDGVLQDFQRHRARLWSVYNLRMGAFGDLSFSGLWRIESARNFSLRTTGVNTNATQRAILKAAGYPDGPGSFSVYYADRGSELFKGYGLFDTSINYNIPVFRSLRPWVKFDVYNLFDNQKMISWNTTVTQDSSTPADSLGFRTGFKKGSSFGKATGNTNFPLAFTGADRGGRTFRVAVGFRF